MSAFSLSPVAGLGLPEVVYPATGAPRQAELRDWTSDCGLALCVAGPASPAELAAMAELGRGLLRKLEFLAAQVARLLLPSGKP